MARSHHRKKHKEHLRNFKQSHEGAASVKAKGKASGVFTFGGVAVGLLLGYLASNGLLVWAIVGLVAGGAAGYLIGRSIDRGSS
jgi:VIT1/CCC1 family predicted Fe2+/Mn2+ transporter